MQKYITLGLLPLFAVAELAAQSSEFLATGIYDTGRLRANASLDFHAFNQWNGEFDNPGNVGWSRDGIWWSFARFGGAEATHKNPELFDKIVAADQIRLHLGVLWNEISSGLVGLVPPGVTVGAYLVPEMDIPEGSLPTFPNAWPFSYANQIKLFEIDPATVPTTNADWNDYQFSPPTEQQRLDNLQPYDITTGIKEAIAQGLLDNSTPWGIVFFNEEALPDLTPNNPDWSDARGTVLDMRYMQLELVTGLISQPQWAGYDILESGWVQTGSFLGDVYPLEDYVWIQQQDKWVYLPEAFVHSNGAWMYLFK
jgi:hypothetical protein